MWANTAAVVVTVVLLRWQGRRWWCECGQWNLWSSDAWGSHNSQHLLDPYALTHVLHGLLLYGLFALLLPRLSLHWRLVLTVCVECAWEVVENSEFVINRYREATAALGYMGDSVVNSLGDLLSCMLGFWLAGRLGFWKSCLVFIALELVLLVWIRDCLILNVIMLLYPLDSIRDWQSPG